MTSPLAVVGGTHGRSGRSGAMSGAEVAQPASQTEARTAAMVPLRRRIIGRFLVNIFRKVGDYLFQFCEGSLDGRRDRARPGGPWHWLWSNGRGLRRHGSSAGIRGVAETLREPFKAARCASEAGGIPDRRR